MTGEGFQQVRAGDDADNFVGLPIHHRHLSPAGCCHQLLQLIDGIGTFEVVFPGFHQTAGVQVEFVLKSTIHRAAGEQTNDFPILNNRVTFISIMLHQPVGFIERSLR